MNLDRILADVNVPEEYASALRGDGYEVTYSHTVDELGPEATDDEIVDYAERERSRYSRRTSRTSPPVTSRPPYSSLHRT